MNSPASPRPPAPAPTRPSSGLLARGLGLALAVADTGRVPRAVNQLLDVLVGTVLEMEQGAGDVVATSARVAAPLAAFAGRRALVRNATSVVDRGIQTLSARGRAVREESREAGVALWRRAIAAIVGEVLAQVDVDALIDRVDLDRIVDRLDFDRLIDRVDVTAIAANVDVEAVIDEMDVPAITRQMVEEGHVDDIIRESTASIGAEMVDAVRLKGANADRLVNRIVDAILLRRNARESGEGGLPGPTLRPSVEP